MNSPYPANSQLQAERLADSLLDEQYTAAAAFRRALAAFAAAFDAITFPLGSPVKGYDVADISHQITDWMLLRDHEDYAAAATDAAQVAS